MEPEQETELQGPREWPGTQNLGGDEVCGKSFNSVRLFATSWIVVHQAPLSMGFSRQEYWSGSPFLSSGDLLNPGIESPSLISPALARKFFIMSSTWGAQR